MSTAKIRGVGTDEGTFHRIFFLSFEVGIAGPSLGGDSCGGNPTAGEVGGGSLGIKLNVSIVAPVEVRGGDAVVVGGGGSSGSSHHGTYHGRRGEAMATEALDIGQDGV